MNLDSLFERIQSKYGVSKEDILSRKRQSHINYCRILIIGYLVEVHKVDFYTIASYFNRDRTNIYNIVKNYRELEFDDTILDGIKLNIKILSDDMLKIKYLIERYKIQGDLKEYLLAYKEKE